MSEEINDKRCKVAFCKCGVRVQLVAALPYGDIDEDCLKDFAEFAKLDRKIDYIKVAEMKEIFGGCFSGECYQTKQLKINYHE